MEEKSGEWRYFIVVSVLEIYNETVCDLLAARNHCTDRLEVKQEPDGVYVPGLTQIQVNTLEEVNEVQLIYIVCTCVCIELHTMYTCSWYVHVHYTYVCVYVSTHTGL